MSGLGHNVRLEAKKGKIIISQSENPRQDWSQQIQALLAEGNDPATEFNDMEAANSDGLGSLPWNGPSFSDWQKSRAKIS